MNTNDLKLRLKSGDWPVAELSSHLCMSRDKIEAAKDNPITMMQHLNAHTEDVRIGYMTQFEQWGCQVDRAEMRVINGKRVHGTVRFMGFGPSMAHAVMSMFVDRRL